MSENEQPDRGKSSDSENKASRELELRKEAVGEIYELAVELYPNWNKDRLFEHLNKLERLDLADLQSMESDYREKLKRKSKNILSMTVCILKR